MESELREVVKLPDRLTQGLDDRAVAERNRLLADQDGARAGRRIVDVHDERLAASQVEHRHGYVRLGAAQWLSLTLGWRLGQCRQRRNGAQGANGRDAEGRPCDETAACNRWHRRLLLVRDVEMQASTPPRGDRINAGFLGPRAGG